MEIKVLIFIAFILISVISSIVKGLRKFNETRPGRNVSGTEPTETVHDTEEIFREIQRRFGEERKQVIVEEPVMPESVITPEVVATTSGKKLNRERKSPVEMKQQSRMSRKKNETPTVSVSNIDKVPDFDTGNGVDMPDSVEDFRKMVVWSAILNRPYA